ncbi:neuronal acetylcholine receptor subunit alpha-9-II-like [Symsagittifera roscoffensis]|uniref:neuronal acetylcholine receptor subunit alpha-9-II-like n=1 Tax=Symsagittifera roscoffensis TaxID=84072 RepID=UPI00307CA09E
MVVVNSLSSFEFMGSSNLPLIVGYTGFTYYSVPVIMKTKCQATVTYFPFDEQLCEIRFLSWTYHSRMVNVTLASYTNGLEGHIGNIEWKITNITSSIVNEHDVSNHPLYEGETIRYPYIRYRIHLSRKPDFYVNSLITPSLLLSWLGSIIFLLPSDCGEKLGFSVTLFLALYVNQVVVSDFLPPSADSFPLLARFYTTITLIMGLSIILTVVSLTVHFRVEPKLVPLKGSLLAGILKHLENLGSCSLLATVNSFFKLFQRSKNNSPKASEKTNSSGIANSSSKFGLIRDTSLIHSNNHSRVSSVHNGYNCTNRPVDFVYNSACADPIPNTASQILDPESGDELLNASYGRRGDAIGHPEVDRQRRVAHPEESQFELPQDIANTLEQIKSSLSIMAKYWSTRSEEGAGGCKSGSSRGGGRRRFASASGDVDKRRWVLVAAGMDTVFFFIYILILTAVTLFFAWKSIMK